MTYQPFIASYFKDFHWLRACLASLRLHGHGFLPPLICTDTRDAHVARQVCDQTYPESQVVVLDGQPGRGMVRAMISMLSCDLFSQADCYVLIGSDCLVTRAMTPEAFCKDGKPIMLYNRFSDIGPSVDQWRISTNNILGIDCEFETMRRLPLFYPRAVLVGLREYLTGRHKMPVDQYLGSFSGHCPWSESNLLGSYAKRFMPEHYVWMHASADDPTYLDYQNVDSGQLLQMWSHGGTDLIMDRNTEYMPGRWSGGKTPRQVIRDVLGSTFL